MDSTGTKTFMRDGVDVTDPVLSDGAANYTSGVSERRSGTSKFYGSDRLGSATQETTSAQTVSATKTYDAFGMLTASTGSSASPFGFVGSAGYQSDNDSGLQLLGHRYYDSSTGRFLTRDPIKAGRNWYRYCGNNPVSVLDPWGQDGGYFQVIINLVKGNKKLEYHVAEDALQHVKDLREGGEIIGHGGHNGGPKHFHNTVPDPENPRFYLKDPISEIHVTSPDDADAAPAPEWSNWKDGAKWVPYASFAICILTEDYMGAGEEFGKIIDPYVKDSHKGFNAFARQRWLDSEDAALLG